MKNLNLLLVTLIFSSLLVGCGMKGPLYREEATPSPKIEQEKQQQVTNSDEVSNEDETQATTQ